jgi:hypothetical protein
LVVVVVKVTGRANLLIDLNKHPSVIETCNDVCSEDVYDAGPSQPPSWESEVRHDEDILEEIMEEKARAIEREDMQSHEHRVVVSSLTDIDAIIEEKTNVGNLEVIGEDFVVLEKLNIPSSACVPLVASSSQDGDPYTFDTPNVEDEKYEDSYAGDSMSIIMFQM